MDAETFVPLPFQLYAKDTPDPVVSYEASDFQVGPVPDNRFQLETPPGAEVAPMDESGNGGKQGKEGGAQEPRQVASVEEAQQLVGFPVKQLASAPGGRELSEIRVAGSDAGIQTYDSGWGAVTLVQKSESADESQTGQSQEESSSSEKDGQGGQPQVPTVDLGGVEAKEISTPIGTALSWSADGISYSLVGSTPAADLEDAARGVLDQA